MAARGPQNGRRGLERGLLLLNKSFDPSSPSMRKVDNGEKKDKKEKRKENNDVYSGH